MDASDPDKPCAVGPRIRWRGADEEMAMAKDGRPTLARTHSNTSHLSIHSIHSRRESIDPSTALPIQYRTV